jgi:hypothetical protein
MFITTAGRTTEEMKILAQSIAKELSISYFDRNKKSVAYLQQFHDDSCIVVGKERLELFPLGETEPFFFHPNSAMFRIKRLLKGEHDPFIDACQLEKGMSFLDCTLGLASDSIVASFQVGREGNVTGLEGEKFLSYMVRNGLQNWTTEINEMNDSMRRIEVLNTHCYDYLKNLPNNSVDCIYFDPMFENNILESDGIQAITNIAIYNPLKADWIEEALRVARKRVVLKDHYLSNRFSQFGFEVIRRKTAKFHFGFIEKQS